MAKTPPNTLQQACAVAWQNKQTNRNLDSPEHRHTPDNPVPPQIAPLRFNDVPIPQPPVLPGNVPIPDDPFALPPAPVHFNGHQYQNLPQHLAEQLHNLPALCYNFFLFTFSFHTTDTHITDLCHLPLNNCLIFTLPIPSSSH